VVGASPNENPKMVWDSSLR